MCRLAFFKREMRVWGEKNQKEYKIDAENEGQRFVIITSCSHVKVQFYLKNSTVKMKPYYMTRLLSVIQHLLTWVT